MTVCIAAACLEDDKHHIVMCSDWLASSSLGSADIHLKQKTLGRHWTCLVAGNSAEINAVTGHLRTKIRALDLVDETNVCSALREAMLARKREKTDEFLAAQFGLSYDEFYTNGKAKFPEGVFRDTLLRISQIKVEAELILAGFVAGFAYLIEATNEGVKIREDFATIGEGSYIAQSVLLQREHSEIWGLDRTIYTVFEAKKYAERVPSVGEMTTTVILDGNGGRRAVTSDGILHLRALYAKFGPQPLHDIKFEDKHLERRRTPWDSADNEDDEGQVGS